MPGFPWPGLLKTFPAGLAEGAGYGSERSFLSVVARPEDDPRGGGSIINIFTSVYGLVAAPARAAYCASKAACNMLTKVLAIEWAKKNIRVNAVAFRFLFPGTELVQGVIESGMLPLGAIRKRSPLGPDRRGAGASRVGRLFSQ